MPVDWSRRLRAALLPSKEWFHSFPSSDWLNSGLRSLRRLGFDAAVKREGKLALASSFKKASHQASNATSKPKASCSAVHPAEL